MKYGGRESTGREVAQLHADSPWGEGGEECYSWRRQVNDTFNSHQISDIKLYVRPLRKRVRWKNFARAAAIVHKDIHSPETEGGFMRVSLLNLKPL